MKIRYTSVSSTAPSAIMNTKPSYGSELYEEIERPASPTDILVAALFPDSPDTRIRSTSYNASGMHNVRRSITKDTIEPESRNSSLDLNSTSKTLTRDTIRPGPTTSSPTLQIAAETRLSLTTLRLRRAVIKDTVESESRNTSLNLDSYPDTLTRDVIRSDSKTSTPTLQFAPETRLTSTSLRLRRAISRGDRTTSNNISRDISTATANSSYKPRNFSATTSSSYRPRNISSATTTSSFEEWYDHNPHWPTFRDTDIHAVWNGLPNSPVEVDIRFQVLSQAGETQEIFHHSHESVKEWNLVSAKPDPHALYFRKFKDQRKSFAIKRMDQYLSSDSTDSDLNNTDTPLQTPPSYSDITVSKTRSTSTVSTKSNYLRKRSTKGKALQSSRNQPLTPSPRSSRQSTPSTYQELPSTDLTTTTSTHLTLSTPTNARVRIHIKTLLSLLPHPTGGYQLHLPISPLLLSQPDFPSGVLHLHLPTNHAEIAIYDPQAGRVVPCEKRFEIDLDVTQPVGVRLFLLQDHIKKKEEEAQEIEQNVEESVGAGKASLGIWWKFLLFLFVFWVGLRAFAQESVVGVEKGVVGWVVGAKDLPEVEVLSVVEVPVDEAVTDEADEAEEKEEWRFVIGPVTIRDHVDWVLGWKGPNGEWEGFYR